MMQKLAKIAAISAIVTIGSAVPSSGQNQFSQPQTAQPQAGQPQPGRPQAAQQQAGQQQIGQQPGAPQAANPQQGGQSTHPLAGAPFILSNAEQAEMDQLLAAWEQQSNGTKRLEAKFLRWHYDPLAAPAGVHATWAEGSIKYGAPDMGLFRVDQLKFFSGIVEGKPTYKSVEGQFGEHWVCNGKELLEFDHSAKECRIQQLPPEMQGKDILESPLPFVFNLNAARIQERYWVRRIAAPGDIFVIEAHPKRQADRAQYRFVRVVIDNKTFLPKALLLYGPNFDPTTAAAFDHYEFSDVKRNTVMQNMAAWGAMFINERPPADWKVIRDMFRPAGPQQPQMAQPGADKTLR
jgi:TIGR03009 family protein